ncbi:MAG: DUF4833 domain-containing protein [Deltaproteobacteria bacterium]|nr:DUF4833 domain-containing protein [Deltaproteobacteria bacterium]
MLVWNVAATVAGGVSMTAFTLVVACAGGVASAGGKPDSAFHVDSNQSRNQVHYGVHTDQQCRPSGEEPAYNYWLRLGHVPATTRPLSFLQQVAYGFKAQRVRGDGRVELRLRALPERLFTIRAAPGPDGCKTETFVTIDGREAYLDKVFVFADEGIFLPDVRYIELYGHTNDGHATYEKISIKP